MAESSDWKSEGFTVKQSLEIRLEHFHTNKEKTISKPIENFYRCDSGFFFHASVKDIEGWLAVRPKVRMDGAFSSFPDKVLSWIVSIIDIEGNSRFPRSFEIEYDIKPCIILGLDDEYDALQKRLEKSQKNITCAKYLKRSFVLGRSDEFLRNGVLTLRCDISLSCPIVSSNYLSRVIFEVGYRPFETVIVTPPEPINDDDGFIFSFIDLRSLDLTTGFRHWDEKFNISGNYPDSESFTTASKDDEEENSHHHWTFYARSDEFILTLDERQDSVGTRLLKASPVITQYVSSMKAYDAYLATQVSRKDQPKNTVKLQNVDGILFKLVLFFLVTGKLPMLSFDELVSTYKLSHFFQMEELKQKCEQDIVNSGEQFEGLEKIAEFHKDEYLSSLLRIARKKNENFERNFQQLRENDTPYSGCYI